MDKPQWDQERQSATDEVLGLLDSYMASAVVGAAMELGLFWQLDREPQSEAEIAGLLGIPVKRCQYWLQYLSELGLIEPVTAGYRVSSKAQAAILDAYSQDTWALLAKESREKFPIFQYLSSHFREQGSVWEAVGLVPPMYVERMNEDPLRARQFTRMLYELHQPLAGELADLLDMSDINHLMDLGGGSGVVSMALLRRYSNLSALVVDIPNVCRAGHELAIENAMQHRLRFFPADFMHDALPTGFDMVLECDVGVYNEALFEKVRASLNPGGRYVIVDQFAPAKGLAPRARLAWALQGSLIDADFSYPTADEIKAKLEKAGFQWVSSCEMRKLSAPTRQFTEDMHMIDARV